MDKLELAGRHPGNDELVPAVKQPWDEKMAKPRQLHTGFHLYQRWFKYHGFASGGGDRHEKARSLLKVALNRSDEWIPLREFFEVGERGPDSIAGCRDVDVRLYRFQNTSFISTIFFGGGS